MPSLADLFGYTPISDVFRPFLTPVAGPPPRLSDAFTPYLTPINEPPPLSAWSGVQNRYDPLSAFVPATFPFVGGSSFPTLPPAANVGLWRPKFGAASPGTCGDAASFPASAGVVPRHGTEAVDPSSREPGTAERPNNEPFAAPDGPTGFLDPSGNVAVRERNERDRSNAGALRPLPNLAGNSGTASPYVDAGNASLDRIYPSRLPADSTVISDADPEAWIEGARYAQYRSRSGRRGPGGRELSPPEEIRMFFHDVARKTLQELDPNNQQLLSLSSPAWVPDFGDIRGLNAEIARIRRERARSDLEPHHTLPRQFESKFKACGIDPEDYVMYMSIGEHRLRPDGWHTGPDHWNAQWRRFLAGKQNPSSDEVLKQLNNMLKQKGR